MEGLCIVFRFRWSLFSSNSFRNTESWNLSAIVINRRKGGLNYVVCYLVMLLSPRPTTTSSLRVTSGETLCDLTCWTNHDSSRAPENEGRRFNFSSPGEGFEYMSLYVPDLIHEVSVSDWSTFLPRRPVWVRPSRLFPTDSSGVSVGLGPCS